MSTDPIADAQSGAYQKAYERGVREAEQRICAWLRRQDLARFGSLFAEEIERGEHLPVPPIEKS